MHSIKKFLNEQNKKLNIKDYLTLGIILLLYGILSFINLGSTINLNTFLRANSTDQVVIELERYDDIIKMKIFNGERNAKYQIYTSLDNKNYVYLNDFEGDGAFSWQEERLLVKAKYIKILFLDDSSVGELAFYNNSKEKIPIKNVKLNNKNNKLLYDEQSTIPKQISYMNSSYFDEVYFARTAYEYANGIETYEWTHPPLGKLIQAIPIYLTKNMSPFNYRLMGNIAGILMILVMYLFGKELFKKRKYAIFSALLMAFDTFHFAHTRMGTVDSHLVLFIMLAIYFMIKFVNSDKTRYLFFSGLFFGLSVCVKWTGFYGGLALAIMYFIYLISKKKIKIGYIVKGISFFVIIPLIIYCSLYLLFPNNKLNYTKNISSIVKQQQEMYNYHSNLDATHPFSSSWYTWPISYKPVWYHQEVINTTTKETIAGIGNIVIWWTGILAMIYLIYKFIRKKDRNALILLISILSLWLPYVFIGRIMFLYHYFPVLPFVMLGIVLMFKDLEEKTKMCFVIPIYLCLVIAFFIIYYPVVSGKPTSIEYIDSLKLLSSWIF